MSQSITCISQTGAKIWYVEDPDWNRWQYKLHREDGPAIEYPNGGKSWYWNGKKVPCKTQEEFERLIRLKAFW